jgi:hypothetical protein
VEGNVWVTVHAAKEGDMYSSSAALLAVDHSLTSAEISWMTTETSHGDRGCSDLGLV